MRKIVLLLLAFLVVTSVTVSAWAADSQELDPKKDYLLPLNQICGTQIIPNGGHGGGDLKFISTIVHCFESSIYGLAEDSMQKMSNALADAVNAAMLIYVIFFGARLIMGMVSSPKSELIVHAIKLGVVGWLINNMGIMELWDLVLNAYQGMLEIMIAPAQIDSCPAQIVSLDYVWDTMDCLFAKLIGYNAQNGFGSSWQGVALLFSALIAKTNFGSGLIIPAIVANAILTVLFSFLQIAMAYIISLIGLTMLFALAPLLLPMMFFKATYGYFEAWYKMMISFILQVSILFAFTSFAFAIMNEIYNGPGGLKEMFGSTKISNEVARTDTLGTSTMYWQKATATFNEGMQGKGDVNMIVNFISLMVLGYLMLSFVNVIGKIAQEISGASIFPNLMENNGAGMNIGIPKV